jgi:hypothetical protein
MAQGGSACNFTVTSAPYSIRDPKKMRVLHQHRILIDPSPSANNTHLRPFQYGRKVLGSISLTQLMCGYCKLRCCHEYLVSNARVYCKQVLAASSIGFFKFSFKFGMLHYKKTVHSPLACKIANASIYFLIGTTTI